MVVETFACSSTSTLGRGVACSQFPKHSCVLCLCASFRAMPYPNDHYEQCSLYLLSFFRGLLLHPAFFRLLGEVGSCFSIFSSLLFLSPSLIQKMFFYSPERLETRQKKGNEVHVPKNIEEKKEIMQIQSPSSHLNEQIRWIMGNEWCYFFSSSFHCSTFDFDFDSLGILRRWYSVEKGNLLSNLKLEAWRKRKYKLWGGFGRDETECVFVEMSWGVYDFILFYFIVADSTIQAGRSMC